MAEDDGGRPQLLRQLSDDRELEHWDNINYAVKRGDASAVRFFTRQPGFDPNAADEHERSPLYLACLTGRTEIARMLLEAGATDPDGSAYISALKGYRIEELLRSFGTGRTGPLNSVMVQCDVCFAFALCRHPEAGAASTARRLTEVLVKHVLSFLFPQRPWADVRTSGVRPGRRVKGTAAHKKQQTKQKQKKRGPPPPQSFDTVLERLMYGIRVGQPKMVKRALTSGLLQLTDPMPEAEAAFAGEQVGEYLLRSDQSVVEAAWSMVPAPFALSTPPGEGSLRQAWVRYRTVPNLFRTVKQDNPYRVRYAIEDGGADPTVIDARGRGLLFYARLRQARALQFSERRDAAEIVRMLERRLGASVEPCFACGTEMSGAVCPECGSARPGSAAGASRAATGCFDCGADELGDYSAACAECGEARPTGVRGMVSRRWFACGRCGARRCRRCWPRPP